VLGNTVRKNPHPDLLKRCLTSCIYDEHELVPVSSPGLTTPDQLRTLAAHGMVNELLCKVLCHNLTCLIQEQETFGITPVSWKDEGEQANETPAILPMLRGG
jgi:hypothetical protein